MAAPTLADAPEAAPEEDVELFEALVAQGREAQQRGEHAAAVALFERALRELDDPEVRALRDASRAALDAPAPPPEGPPPAHASGSLAPHEIVLEPPAPEGGGPLDGLPGPDPMLMIVGFSTFGVTYTACLGIGLGVREAPADRRVGDWLMVPFIGPIAAIAILSEEGVIEDDEDPLAYLLGWAAGLQLAGAAIGIIGATTFAEDVERAETAAALGGLPIVAGVSVGPWVGRDSSGAPAPGLSLGLLVP